MRECSPSLRSVLAPLPDPRHVRGRRHPWPTWVLPVLVALLCGADGQRGIARFARRVPGGFRRALGLPRAGAPSLATLHRVRHALDEPGFEREPGGWQQRVRRAWRRSTARWVAGIAVAGKPLRAAKRLGGADAHLPGAR